MTLKEQHGLSGRLYIVVSDAAGRIVDERRINNLITTAGRQVLAQMFAGEVQANGLRIAVGTDASVHGPEWAKIAQVADAPASVEITLPQMPTDSAVSKAVSVVVQDPRALAKVVATLPASGDPNPQAIQEAGIVIVLPDRQIIYNRVTFPVINRAGTLEMTLTWEVSF